VARPLQRANDVCKPLTTVERLQQLDWWRHDVVPWLRPDAPPDNSATVAAAVVVESHDLRHRVLGELFPGLDRVCNGRPSDHVTTTRARNVLHNCSPDAWADIADLSAERLGTWRNAGPVVVTEIVAGVMRAWAHPDVEVLRTRRADVNTQEAHPEPNHQPDPVRNLELAQRATTDPTRESRSAHTQALALKLCRHAYRAGAQDVREGLALAAATDEGVLADVWGELASLRLDDALGLRDGSEDAWQTLLNFDSRERKILENRTFAIGEPLTLGALGEMLIVTRERIRQIERRIKDELQERLASRHACAPIANHAARLRRQLGTLAPNKAVTAALIEAVPDGADTELRRGVLLDLAGPYRLNDGFWQRATELADLKATLAQRVDEAWTDMEVEQLLESSNVVSAHRAACVAALPLHRFDDRMLVWMGSLADKSHRVLRVHGEPMTREQLHAAVGADVNFRSLLMQVQSDDRFRRMGLNSYGLTEWGGEEYTTIADEIEQAIERRGGRAAVEELVEELVELFGVSPQSVRSYAGSRRFVRQTDGTLAVATDSHTSINVVRMPPESDRDLIRHHGAWAVRIVVDRDVLRGSGRPVRTAIAQAAGVWPGEARTIELQNGSAQITWRGTQPTLGSTRVLVETLGCADGDLLFIPLEDGAKAFAVASAELTAVGGVARLAREIGLPSDAQLAAIATAVGLPADASPADLRTRLRARRQSDLEALVPDGAEADDHVLLDELMQLGE